LSDNDYISIPVTRETPKDPDEPGIHPLEAMSRRLDADFIKQGIPVSRMELRPEADPGYIVNFIPKRGSAVKTDIELRKVKLEDCPACGAILERDGRCRACWGDVMGLCDVCDSILEHGELAEDKNYCPKCTPKVIQASSD
jgi:predicted RNA-binding Zn-ribbon protein involved in translation (DUF1610 family)